MPPMCNLELAELKALKDLRADDMFIADFIVILSVDKGSAMVVMETQDCHRRIEELLDPNTYKRSYTMDLNRDPTVTVLRKTDALIKQSSTAPDAKAAVWVSETLQLRLYGLPKLHKPDVP